MGMNANGKRADFQSVDFASSSLVIPANYSWNCGREVRHLVVNQADDGSSPFSSAILPGRDSSLQNADCWGLWSCRGGRPHAPSTFMIRLWRSQVGKAPHR